jgi:nucleoside-diphosphate-sugar epimerase
MKILITGSTGFVGKNLIPKLLNDGHEVLEITRDISKSTMFFGDTTTKLLIGDKSFENSIVAFKPEIVIHLASYLTSSDSWSDVEQLVSTNILFLSRILDVVSNVDLKLFVNTGTFAEYFKGDDELLPAYFYAATKTASRAIVDYYSNAYKFKQTTIVPYTIYGGDDSQRKILDIIVDSALTQKHLDLSLGEQILDFIHIDDVTNFYITVLKNINKLPHKTNFKLGTGIGHNLKQVASYIEEITNRKANINWGGIGYRNTDVMFAVANLENINSVLDWNPQILLKDGITKLLLESNNV